VLVKRIETNPTAVVRACCSAQDCGLINNLGGIVARGNKQTIYIGGN